MRDISLSLFFPAYNEESNIEKSVRAAETALKAITKTYEIIIVDDGSQDKTGEIADRLTQADPAHIKVIHHKPNQGYGAALRSGFRAAQYEYVFFSDSDLQFDLSEIKKLVAFVPEYDVVLGYRAPRKDPFFRKVNAALWNVANRLLFGLNVKDIDCAFKLFKRELVKDLPMTSGGAMLSAELLIRLQRQGIKFKQVPVTHLPNNKKETTGAKPHVIYRAFKEMWAGFNGDLSHPTYRQFVFFTVIGAVNTVGDFILYFLLTRTIPYFHGHPVTTKGLTFIIFSISSFFANRTWTFRVKHKPTIAEATRFFTTAGTGLAVNVGATALFLRVFHIYDLIAVVLATIASYAWNFLFQKFWVFRHKPVE